MALAACGALYLSFRSPSAVLSPGYVAEADRMADSSRLSRSVPLRKENPGLTDTAAPRAPSRYHPPKPEVFIELNRADSLALLTVKGIGPVLSGRILRYRERLGGFVRIDQLKEVYGIREENFEALARQFFIDTAEIQKIDINFAPANEMNGHPYFTRSLTGRIVRARKLKGGWSNLQELTREDILLPQEAEKVSPYVSFGTIPGPRSAGPDKKTD